MTTAELELIHSSRWNIQLGIFRNIVFYTQKNICCGYLLESPHRGDSNKYPQHMFLGVYSQKASLLLPFILLYVGILYNSILFNGKMLGTKAVVITRVLCIRSEQKSWQRSLCNMFYSGHSRAKLEVTSTWEYTGTGLICFSYVIRQIGP